MASESILKYFLRIVGTFSLFSLIFVAAPFSWMNSIHQSLGMGILPENPVVGYLARSTSAFYALLGGLMWVLSWNIRKYVRILIYLGFAVALFGCAIFIIDWQVGMPSFWRNGEGPINIFIGILILVTSYRIRLSSL